MDRALFSFCLYRPRVLQSVTKRLVNCPPPISLCVLCLGCRFEELIFALSRGVLCLAGERGSEFFAAEDVDHAFQVISQGGQADFGLCAGESAQQQVWVAEDAVL
jgi:hypothetical protein